MEWLKNLMNNPIAWLVLALLTVISFGYAIYCQRKNKECKEFSYTRKSNSLIHKKKSKFEKLLITYDSQEIENLCVSKFTLWNSGNKTINNLDMVNTKEVSIHLSNNAKILDTEIIGVSDETNDFKIETIDDTSAKILFDYVDKKEGIVFQIIHTGTEEDISIDCKIKGGKPIKNTINDSFPNVLRKVMPQELLDKFFVIFIGTIIALFFLITIACIVSIFNTDLQKLLFGFPNISEGQNKISSTSAAIISILFGFFLCY